MRRVFFLVAVIVVAGVASCGSKSKFHPMGSTDLGPAPTTCVTPISPAPTTAATVVGDGTSGSCTAAALSAAVKSGGAITFNCGGPATINIAAEIALPIDRDTVLDGGGTITLDGGGASRILHFPGTDYRAMNGPQHTVTVQHLSFANAKASGTAINVPGSAPAACSRGTGTDGGGGAIFMESGILHVIDCVFTNNQAAELGPDVAGGGIYAIGSTDLTIVGSQFSGNSASNGGAVGCLNSDLTIVDDVFDSSQATGNGANSVDTSMCPGSVNGGQIGSGGNGGAISIDGGSDGTVTLCGCTFTHNTAGAFGGAMFRTPDKAVQLMQIDRTTFDNNAAPTSGGGVMYIQNSTLTISSSTLSNNSAVLGGAFQADMVQFTLENVTVAGNVATDSNGGAFFVSDGSSSGGTFTNVTVANNQAQNTVEYQSYGGATFGAAFEWNNCIIDNNTDNDNNGHMACDHTGTGANSIEWPMNTTPSCAANIQFADPMLAALADNGGPTQTMVPGAAASAVQIGTKCPPTDQTGQPRATPCTVGAFEVR
jgi:hypothetical protein